MVSGGEGGALGGWDTAAAAAAADPLSGLGGGVWGAAAMQLPFRTVGGVTVGAGAGVGGPGGRGAGGVGHLSAGSAGGSGAGAAAGLMATCSGEEADEGLHGLGADELSANDLAQDIMRAVVD